MKNIIPAMAMLINFITSVVNMANNAIDKAIYFMLLAILMTQIIVVNNLMDNKYNK